MDRQLIISIGREFGSGGHEIAKKLAEKLEIELYDRNILEEVAGIHNVNTNDLAAYDEKPKLKLFHRTVRGYSSSPEENIAEMQFALIKSKAADDDSFVIVGRCADILFKGNPSLISIFIYADKDEKIKRIMKVRSLKTEKEAEKEMNRRDKRRAAYHNYFSKDYSWGETTNYDLCINSSKLGIDGTVDFIIDYINKRK